MDDAETLSLDALARRMSAYRERAATARCLAGAITDKRATTGLLAHAEEFEKKAAELATQIVELAHAQDADKRGDLAPAKSTLNTTRPKRR
jgi:predicted  nucleic acid-binding Zn-ribbon protein